MLLSIFYLTSLLHSPLPLSYPSRVTVLLPTPVTLGGYRLIDLGHGDPPTRGSLPLRPSPGRSVPEVDSDPSIRTSRRSSLPTGSVTTSPIPSPFFFICVSLPSVPDLRHREWTTPPVGPNPMVSTVHTSEEEGLSVSSTPGPSDASSSSRKLKE